jgi:tryptophan halogenase
MKDLYNRTFVELWDGIRDFLALHYRFNTRLKNKFWTTCCNEADVSALQPLLDFYQENGPTGMCRHLHKSIVGANNQFGIEGFLVMLVGQKVPYNTGHPVSEAELAIFRKHCLDNRERARTGLSVAEALKFVKHPGWRWFGDKQD